MNDKLRAKEITKKLKDEYGKEIPTYLHYHKQKPYEFLFAVIMSAQCKDDTVNKVTEKLYKKYLSLDDFINAKLSELYKDIHSLGFYKAKANSIKKCAKELKEKYKGKIPKTVEELIKLPGVGRKTANVVLPHLYGIPGMAVDTHVKRLTNKIFALNENNVKKIEEFLCQNVDKKDWQLWNTHLIAHGRKVCKGKIPPCKTCIIKSMCKWYTYNN